MRSADEALSREVERGMTREHLLRRAAALGIVVAGGTFGPLTEAAFASTQIKRGGTFRQAVFGGAGISSTVSTSSRSRTSSAWWRASKVSPITTTAVGSSSASPRS